MEIGYIKPRKLVNEMKESYLDYAMSVIVARALPDARDGLKPVHRRILYAMWTLGLRSSASYRKSATVVGEVLGKYHPHGDTAVYDAMVRMAQDFSMRYPLVNGQGNFGSMDGDAAAAMRYTEAKLEKISDELLLDIEKETVDFADNYDNSQKEPRVLPAKLPNLLLNGTVGIAVGMATNIPPHNLTEIVDGITHIIDNPDCTLEELMQFVKGPDFPTGGFIYNKKDIATAYATGRGGIVMRAKTDIVETKKGGHQIIVTELPFQVNKANLITKIATLVKDKKIEGIRDLRDESDKDGVRVVIELKRESFPKKTLNKLFKLTQLQDKFHVNLIALVDGIKPQVLSLKAALEQYIMHRQIVVTRRTEFELKKAKARAHILEGLKKALDHIDEIIETIKKSADRDKARTNLMKKWKFSELQAEAILNMRLSQLAALERKKIEDELKALLKLIKELEAILADPKKILAIIKDELSEIKEKFGDERRTQVYARAVDSFSDEDLIANEDLVISMTKGGYIKSLAASTYSAQGRGGKGVKGMTTKEDDMIDRIFSCTAHSDIYFFTTKGRVFKIKAYEIPQSKGRQARGQSVVNFLQLGPEEQVTAILPIDKESKAKYLAMVTRNGVIKRSKIADFKNVRKNGLIAINLKGDDQLYYVRETGGDETIMLVTSLGQAIHFKEKDVRAMGRSAAGVRGIKLKKDDYIVGMLTTAQENLKKNTVMIITEKGYAKQTKLSSYKIQGRGGSGLKTAKITSKNGKIINARKITEECEEILAMSQKGQTIRLKINDITTQGRATQGVRIMRLKSGDNVAAVALV